VDDVEVDDDVAASDSVVGVARQRVEAAARTREPEAEVLVRRRAAAYAAA
jgi:hypothetical protein